MRLKLISCEVLYREMCASIATSPHQVDVTFLEKGLHDLGGRSMRGRLQAEVDATAAANYEAVLMGYALCGNGVAGLEARAIPLVIPRAHDCIALLMGSRHRYEEYFGENPGVFFRSTGWLERGRDIQQAYHDRAGGGYGLDELIDRYGEENGRYLYAEFTRYQSAYKKLTYIQTGLEPDGSHEAAARAEAAARGWEFSKIEGSLTLFRRLLAGDWGKEDFLVVRPGWRVCVRYDDQVIAAEEVR
jgi:hypothetical protein